MLNVIKLFWFVIKELMFDSADEYNFRSKHFNFNKVTLAVAIGLSFGLNIWLITRLHDVTVNYVDLKQDNKVCVAKKEEATANLAQCISSLDDNITKQKKAVLKLKDKNTHAETSSRTSY